MASDLFTATIEPGTQGTPHKISLTFKYPCVWFALNSDMAWYMAARPETPPITREAARYAIGTFLDMIRKQLEQALNEALPKGKDE